MHKHPRFLKRAPVLFLRNGGSFQKAERIICNLEKTGKRGLHIGNAAFKRICH